MNTQMAAAAAINYMPVQERCGVLALFDLQICHRLIAADIKSLKHTENTPQLTRTYKVRFT